MLDNMDNAAKLIIKDNKRLYHPESLKSQPAFPWSLGPDEPQRRQEEQTWMSNPADQHGAGR